VPSMPVIVNGTIKDSNGNNANKALVRFNSSSDITEFYLCNTEECIIKEGDL